MRYKIFADIARRESAEKNRIFVTKVFGTLMVLTLFVSVEGWAAKSIIFEQSLYFCGVILTALCIVGRAWSLSYISGNKNQRLITAGPYSLCRNPLYFSNFLGASGLGLCTETLTITFVLIAAFILYYTRVVYSEEKRLRNLFGAEYDRYCERVPQFLPSFKNFIESEYMFISPRSFRKGITDLAMFVIAIGLIEFIEALHNAHVLPILLTLY